MTQLHPTRHASRRRRAVALAGWLLCCMPATAVASEDGSAAEVTWIAVPAFGGGMKRLPDEQTTGFAVITRAEAEEEEPLRAGQVLQAGDTIRCTRAQVLLTTPDGEQIHLREGASITLTEARTVLQKLGTVYYDVRSAFRVEYGTVETAVEGTTFLVEGTEPSGGPVSVFLHEGVVRVTDGGGEIVLNAGQQTTAGAGTGGPAPATKWPATERGEALQDAQGPGGPRLLLGTWAGAIYRGSQDDLLPGGISPHVELLASVRMAGPLRVRVAGSASRVPTRAAAGGQVSPELVFGPVAVGGGVDYSREIRVAPCVTQTVDHLGFVGHTRLTIPLGAHLQVMAEGRATVGSILQAAGGAGIGWAL